MVDDRERRFQPWRVPYGSAGLPSGVPHLPNLPLPTPPVAAEPAPPQSGFYNPKTRSEFPIENAPIRAEDMPRISPYAYGKVGLPPGYLPPTPPRLPGEPKVKSPRAEVASSKPATVTTPRGRADYLANYSDAPLSAEDKRLSNNEVFRKDTTGNLTESDMRRGGLKRLVKTGDGSYTDAPGAKGEERVYSASGSRVDRQPVSYNLDQLRAYAKAHPNMRVPEGGDPLVVAAREMEAKGERATRKQQVDAGIRDLARFGSPNMRSIADAERRARDGLSKEERAALVDAQRAERRARWKEEIEDRELAGRHSRVDTDERVKNLNALMATEEPLQAYMATLPENMAPEEKSIRALEFAQSAGFNMQALPRGMNAEAEAAADIQNRAQRGFDARSMVSTANIGAVPLREMGERRPLSTLEKIGRWNANTWPWLRDDPFGMRDAAYAYDDESPEGTRITRYTTPAQERLIKLLSETDQRAAR